MRLRTRIRYVARRRQLDADLAEELRLHREMAEDAAALRAGATPEDARREVNVAFGSEVIALEDSRAVWRFAWIESVAQDVRFALRGFRRTPGFALTVICTLALGLGMLATAFSVFNALVLRPFAVKDPYSLYAFLGWGETKGQYQTRPFSWRAFKDFRLRNGAFARRRKEFGIRMALGAGKARVTGMVLWQSLRLTVVGAGIGTLAALALARVTAHYGWYRAGITFSVKQLDVFDPAGYIAGALVVIAAAIASAWMSAKRAVSVDPTQTLRCD